MTLEPDIRERMERRSERLHISIGAVCNNNCIFCMEEDRDARYENNSAMTPERVRWLLEQHRGAEEVCFTSGEPTTRPELPSFVGWAKELGYARVSMMTNGRRASHFPYAAALAKAGLNRFYVSIHGHTARLHEGLTRTPGSFDQTVAGIAGIARLKRYGVELHTSTVVTKRNLPFFADIYGFLRGLGVDQVVFNVMQANGRANTFFEQLFPTYTEIASAFSEFVRGVSEPSPMAFLVDIPLCTTETIPDFNRGYVEKYRHFDLESETALPVHHEADRAGQGEGKGLLLVLRSDLDDYAREKRDACRTCRYDSVCEGVWKNYVKRYGWEEMRPIPATSARLTLWIRSGSIEAMSLLRRDFLLSLTAGVAGAMAPAAAKAGEAAPVAMPVVPIGGTHETAPHHAASGIEALVAPLAPGAQIGPWRIEQLSNLEDGAASLVLRDAVGHTFQLDVCARDDSEGALTPPGRSVHFDVYLANGGQGDTASFEHHGLAAMAVADVIRHNEATFDRAGYRTLRERLSTSYDSVKRRA